jgi:para-nitrobenzyl esterase
MHRLADSHFMRALGQSSGMFEPLKLAPNYLLANAEHDGEAYAVSLGAHSLAELRALPASELLKGKAGEISHPVIEPYMLPESPYDAFAQNRQNDVPILIGSDADEARSLVPDLNTIKAETFSADITKRWGPLPLQLVEAYPHATDERARKARARIRARSSLRMGHVGVGAAKGDEGPKQRVILSFRAQTTLPEGIGL